MAHISSWQDLITALESCNGIFSDLLKNVHGHVSKKIKKDSNFDLANALVDDDEIFERFVVMYQQLILEDDVVEINKKINSLTSNAVITFDLISISKWIKIYTGHGKRFYFIDDEKSILSDSSMAAFLNKVEEIRSSYTYFGNHPTIYYKFKTLPSDDVVEYLATYNVMACLLDDPTAKIELPEQSNDKLVIDQSIFITLCSNLSFGLSQSYYTSPEFKDKKIMTKNKTALDKYLEGKQIMMDESNLKQCTNKIERSGGPTEKKRAEELMARMTIVPEIRNIRFCYLKDREQVITSLAEHERTIILTANRHFCRKLSIHYPEMSYELYHCAPLVELKYD